MEPGGSITHSQGLLSNLYPDPNQQDNYFFKIFYNIFLPSTPSLIRGHFCVGLTN